MISTNLSPIIETLSALLAAHPERPVLAALDGRCGSGKTTLAAQLAAQFPRSITVHTDDFYLPPARRSPGWEHTPCANMDLARLRQEVLLPSAAGQPVAYRAYSCREGAFCPTQRLAPQPLVLVEGSYSHHPLLADCYDLKVFVTCTKEEQARRLQAREGERYPNFVRRWIPLEEGYFAACQIETGADIVLMNQGEACNGTVSPCKCISL